MRLLLLVLTRAFLGALFGGLVYVAGIGLQAASEPAAGATPRAAALC